MPLGVPEGQLAPCCHALGTMIKKSYHGIRRLSTSHIYMFLDTFCADQPRSGLGSIIIVIRNCVINYNYNVIVIVIEYFVLA